MKYILPQEIQVWYILPVIRRELSKKLVKENGLTQKETAKTLFLTEGAVSQYLNSKRGNTVKFSETINKELDISAKRLLQNKNVVLEETVRLLNLDEMWDIVCKYHKEHDPFVEGNCSICNEYKEKITERIGGCSCQKSQ